MSDSSNVYDYNDHSKLQMYEVFSTEVSNQVQEPQVNIVEEKIAKKKTNRQQYQNYSETEKDRVIQTYMFTSLSYSKVGEKYGIPVSTLKSWIKAAKEASKKEETLEVDNAIEEQPKTNQHLRKLKEEHTKFLEEFIDNNPVVTLDQMVDALSDKFEGFSISKCGVDKHMKESCSYTKRITKIPAKRNSPDVIELRSRAIGVWIKDSNISFMQNCIFIDKSGSIFIL
jgi:transposase